MSNTVVRNGKVWHEYKVYTDVGAGGEATKVRFGPQHHWVGEDYWYHVKSYKPSRQMRAYFILSLIERRGSMAKKGKRYKFVRNILHKELGWSK